jgi:glycosyltransferase involved in cell wall biosynthesis
MSQVEDGKRGRIAIFFPAPNLGALRTLLDAATLLADKGYLVEIYTLSHPFHPPSISTHPAIVINTECSEIFLDGGVGIPKMIYGRDGRFIRWAGRFSHWVGRLVHWFGISFYRPLRRRRFNVFFRSRHRSLPYVCLIGMNRYGQGLIEAAAYAELLGVPLINWSLELSFMAEQQSEKQRQRKSQEIECSRKAVFTIIQDKWRAQALADENSLPLSSMVLVPNAPMGAARRKSNPTYRERLGIPAGKKLILCSGNIGYTTMNLEIIEAANSLPDEYMLVIQSRQSPSPKFDYASRMVRKANPERVKLFFDPVPTESYRALVDAADVGICFYRPCEAASMEPYSKNMDIVGLSSGKLSDYLYSGLPVIVNDTKGPKDLVLAHQCGKCVNEGGDLESALKELFRDYEDYSRNACRCFDEELELGKFFQPVVERISRL